MKRKGNLFEKFISIENVVSAANSAVKNKGKRKDVKDFLANYKEKLNALIKDLKNDEYIPSEYTTKIIKDKNKERSLSITPFFPDRIVHHMITNILEDIFLPTFISSSYQCIKGRGTHKCIAKTIEYIKAPSSSWVLKADISKYYPSVDNELLKLKIQRKIKDTRFLKIVNALIDSHKGLPLGNHSSQLLGNIFLSDLDNTMKTTSKHYIRYADDIVVFGDKHTVKMACDVLKHYTKKNNLILNTSTQYYKLSKRYLDFLGFRFYKLATSIYYRPKKSKLINLSVEFAQKASIYGWLKDSKSLIYLCKLLYKENVRFFEKFLVYKILPKDKYHNLIIKVTK